MTIYEYMIDEKFKISLGEYLIRYNIFISEYNYNKKAGPHCFKLSSPHLYLGRRRNFVIEKDTDLKSLKVIPVRELIESFIKSYEREKRFDKLLNNICLS